MHVRVVDTETAYRRLLAAPAAESRAAIFAAELHHNIRFSRFPFNLMTTTVGDYIIAEGLAEAFAAEQYGEELIGPWVTAFDESQVARARGDWGSA